MTLENNGHENKQIQGRADHWHLRRAEAGMPIKEIGRKHGFSDASFYKWRSKYRGGYASQANRLQAGVGERQAQTLDWCGSDWSGVRGKRSIQTIFLNSSGLIGNLTCLLISSISINARA